MIKQLCRQHRTIGRIGEDKLCCTFQFCKLQYCSFLRYGTTGVLPRTPLMGDLRQERPLQSEFRQMHRPSMGGT